jgi:hypothetical protein
METPNEIVQSINDKIQQYNIIGKVLTDGKDIFYKLNVARAVRYSRMDIIHDLSVIRQYGSYVACDTIADTKD